MLKNEYLIAKFGLDTAENGPIVKWTVCSERKRVPEPARSEHTECVSESRAAAPALCP